MDTICGLGLPELIILALLSFVLIGPERSQDLALKAGRFLRGVVRSTWWREFNDITRAMRNLPTTLVRMAELEEAQAELQRTLTEIDESARIDRTPVTPPAPPPDVREIIEDPWGIQNAVAGTTHRPARPRPTTTPPEGEEAGGPGDIIDFNAADEEQPDA
ncbi:MAG: hypothetical protein Kow00124_28940 [Anaerolineae bacterium]